MFADKFDTEISKHQEAEEEQLKQNFAKTKNDQ